MYNWFVLFCKDGFIPLHSDLCFQIDDDEMDGNAPE